MFIMPLRVCSGLHASPCESLPASGAGYHQKHPSWICILFFFPPGVLHVEIEGQGSDDTDGLGEGHGSNAGDRLSERPGMDTRIGVGQVMISSSSGIFKYIAMLTAGTQYKF